MQAKNSLLMNALHLACLLLSLPCFAERTDRDKPVHMEADQLVIDDAQQVSVFVGNVKLSQGTMLIRGDRIILKQDKDGFKHGTAYGNTASFRQKRDGLDEYVEGHGERIEYDTSTETVNIYAQAHLKRGMDDLRGEHITYNARTEIFQVDGKSSNQEKGTQKRVRAVLQPKSRGNVMQPASGVLSIKASESLHVPE